MTEITDQNFIEEIKKSAKPVLVDFFTEWCPPCKVLGPILENIAKEFEEDIELLKINLDSIPATAQKFQIDRIPTVMLFKNGEPVSGFVGLQPQDTIVDWLKKSLDDGAGKNN